MKIKISNSMLNVLLAAMAAGGNVTLHPMSALQRCRKLNVVTAI